MADGDFQTRLHDGVIMVTDDDGAIDTKQARINAILARRAAGAQLGALVLVAALAVGVEMAEVRGGHVVGGAAEVAAPAPPPSPSAGGKSSAEWIGAATSGTAANEASSLASSALLVARGPRIAGRQWYCARSVSRVATPTPAPRGRP